MTFIFLLILQVNVSNPTNFNGFSLSIARKNNLIWNWWKGDAVYNVVGVLFKYMCFMLSKERRRYFFRIIFHSFFYFLCRLHCFSPFNTVRLYELERQISGDHIGTFWWILFIICTSKRIFFIERYIIRTWSLKRTNHLPFTKSIWLKTLISSVVLSSVLTELSYHWIKVYKICLLCGLFSYFC